jgi:putative transposase
MSNKAYKFRLYPTRKQIASLQWTLNRCRELYNAALQERKEAYKYAKKSISKFEQMRDLTIIRNEIRTEYQEIGSHVLQDVIKRVDKAYQAFFRRVKNGEKPGYPRFQNEGRYCSFTYPDLQMWDLEGNKIHLHKIGSIKIKLHREIAGKVKTVTIKREGKHWYAVFSCDLEGVNEQRTPYTDDAIGVDLGLHHFAALSSGDIIDNPRYYRTSEAKLIKAQKVLARKQKKNQKTGCKGNRRKKAIQRVAKHHRKIRNQRQDFLHQWSRRLVDTYETIVFEDLAPSKMSKAPRPKQDEETGQYLPNGASIKAGLNKSILDAGWSTFISMCEHKAACAGVVQVVKVDPYKTSQVCSGCLHEGPHKDLSERVHTCQECGLVIDRDVNAAVNILAVSQGLNLRPEKKTKRARARTEPAEDAPLRSPRL